MGTPMEQNVPNPEPVLVCRVCFKLGGKQYSMMDHRVLYDVYEAITGSELANDQGKPPYLCHACAQRLLICARSRHRNQQKANIQARKMPHLKHKKQ